MDIDSMLDSLYEKVKDLNIPMVFGLEHEGEVKALVSGNGKELSIIIGSMIQNISKNTGISAAVIMMGIFCFIKDNERSDETDG